MIVCNSCGHHNEDDGAFCGSCGAFLEWEGQSLAPEVPDPEPEADLEPEEDPQRQGLVDRVVERFHTREEVTGADPSPAVPTSAETDATPAPIDVRPDDEVRGGATSGAPSTAEDPAVAVAARTEREAEEAELAAEAAQRRARNTAKASEQARQRSEQAEETRRRIDPETEKEAARKAADEADAAERARAEAEAEAEREAETAERARRAASLVARPKPVAATRSPPAPVAPGKVAQRKRPGSPATGGTAAAAGAGAGPGIPPRGDPGPDAPGAVRPGQARERPAPKRTVASERRIRPGDLICGSCGEGNPRGRNFCRRCGASLQAAEPAQGSPSRRRWFRRTPEVCEAGDRPMRGGRGGGANGKMRGAKQAAGGAKRTVARVTRIVALLAVVGAAVGVGIGPWRAPVQEWTMERFDRARQVVAPTLEAVNPVSAEASSEAEGHPARNAIVGTNLWWAGTRDNDGIGERLFLEFDPPADIAVVGVIPGAADAGEYVAQPRPRRLHLVFDTGRTETLAIEDRHEFQAFRIDVAEGVSRVEVQIDDVWRGQDGSNVSLTLLEFQIRS